MPEVAAHREGNGGDGLKGFEKFCRSREAWGSVRDGNKGVVTVPSARSISLRSLWAELGMFQIQKRPLPFDPLQQVLHDWNPVFNLDQDGEVDLEDFFLFADIFTPIREQQPRPDRYLVLYCPSLTMQVKRVQSALSPAIR